MKKTAVLFPGVGYTCQKPLLYYTAALAQDYGYEILRLDYGSDIHNFRGRNMDDLDSLVEPALERILPVLKEIDWKQYEEILFISKSIGTVIACRAEKALKISAKHFWMTPIPLTLPYLKEVDGCFVAGTGDPYISSELILQAARDYPEKAAALWEGCNHSLEIKGDTMGNLKRLENILNILKNQMIRVV